MKQTINLLPVKEKVKGDWLAPLNLLCALVAVSVVALSSTVFLAWQKAQHEAQLADYQTQNAQLQQALSREGATLKARHVSGLLQIQKDRLTRQVEAMQQMQTLLSEQRSAPIAGFARPFEVLHSKLPAHTQLESFTLDTRAQLQALTAHSTQLVELPALVSTLERFDVVENQRKMRVSSQYYQGAYQFELRNLTARAEP
ncbi:MAG: hypothetical protein ACPG4U_14815 [Pseudomonadales bacterium]